MRLNKNKQEAFNKLFYKENISLAIDTILEQGFKIQPENETVLQNWTILFGNKGKAEAIKLLKRVQRAKDYDFQQFRKNFNIYNT